jgi:hypothetical protein
LLDVRQETRHPAKTPVLLNGMGGRVLVDPGVVQGGRKDPMVSW